MSKEVGLSKIGITTVLPVVLYLVMLSFFSHLTEENIMTVIIAMLPSVINILLLIFFDPSEKENRLITWLSPVVLSTVFLFIWALKIIPFISQMNGPVLAVLNTFMGYFMTLFFIIPEYVPSITIVRNGKTYDDTDKYLEDTDKYLEDSALSDNSSTDIRPITQQTFLGSDVTSDRKEEDEKELQRLRNALQIHERNSKNYEAQIDLLKKAVRNIGKQTKYTETHMPRQAEKAYEIREALSRVQTSQWKESSALKELREMIKDHRTGYSFQKSQINALMEYLEHYQKKTRAAKEEIDRLKKEITEYVAELEVTTRNMGPTLISVEDKLKAINFVIGRVYSDTKGGNKKIRELLKIPRELYNEFSAKTKGELDGNESDRLVEVIDKILLRLENLEQTENTSIRVKKGRVELKRETGDSILDVLEKNDDDPVKEYHAEAKEICLKVLKYLKEKSQN